MLYSNFKKKKLSTLGLGMMRLPLVDGDNANIDEARTAEMVAYAMQHGLNYFDTAWGYHGGNSERMIKTVLGRYPRDSYYLASKFPGFDRPAFADKEKIFETQLEKCGVEYFDFYLFHNVNDTSIDLYLDEEIGLHAYLMEQKRKGRIHHLGFSTHGSLETMKRLLNTYGEDMEFCQVQLNWLDWELQNAKEKVELLNQWGIPVWVMEPVRGGYLAGLKEAYMQKLRALHPDWTPARWAFRFIQNIPGVAVTLSGMSNMEQLKENIETFSTAEPLSEADMAALKEISADMTTLNIVPCTACRYCTPNCPKELDIPLLLKLNNEYCSSGDDFVAPPELSSLPLDKMPSACIGCRSCEQVCPQNIKISEVLAAFSLIAG